MLVRVSIEGVMDSPRIQPVDGAEYRELAVVQSKLTNVSQSYSAWVLELPDMESLIRFCRKHEPVMLAIDVSGALHIMLLDTDELIEGSTLYPGEEDDEDDGHEGGGVEEGDEGGGSEPQCPDWQPPFEWGT